jgi:hypothetical protein
MSTATPLARTPNTRGWFRRNWKWFIPSMLTVGVLLAAIALFGYVLMRSYRYRANPAYQAALAAVQESPRAQERLGEPIVDADWNPQGDIDAPKGANVGGATFNFTVSGPKGSADVATDGRMVAGQWALTRLELLFPEGERLSLTSEVERKQQVDTPSFDPDKEKERQANAADRSQDKDNDSRELNVEIPDLPPEIK